MSATQASKRDRRQEILAATCRVVVRDGIDGIRSAGVAAEAGTSVGLVHYHYPTLDDLVLAAYLWDEERAWTPIVELSPDADPVAVLRLLLEGQLAAAESDVRASFMLWQEYTRRAVFDEAIRAAVVLRIGRWLDAMSELIRVAHARGVCTWSADTGQASLHLAAALFGSSTLYLIDLIPVDEATADMRTILDRVLATRQPLPVAAMAPRRLAALAPPDGSTADAILDATLRVIARGGIRSVHFADVAQEAGVSTALPRYHHGTLDSLLAAAFARFVGQRRDRALRRAAEIDDPRERVRDAVLMDAALTSYERHDARVIWHEFLRLGFVREDLRGAIGAAVEADIEHIAALIAQAQAADAAAADVVPRAAARRLVEALIGLDLGGLLGLVDDEWAMRILSWAVADELDQA